MWRIGGDQAGLARASRRGARLTTPHDWLLDLFEPFGPISIRRMFGGFGLYRDGVIFGLVVRDGEIYLKCDSDSEPRFRAAGCHPFAFSKDGKQITMSYWSLPSEALDDGDALKIWADLAFAAALRAPRPVKKRKREGGAPWRTSKG